VIPSALQRLKILGEEMEVSDSKFIRPPKTHKKKRKAKKKIENVLIRMLANF